MANTYNQEESEISLLDLAGVLWKRRVMIIVITVVSAVIAVTVSVISLVLPPETSFLPNQYTPQANMLINNTSSGGGGLSSMLSTSGLGGLASLAGVNVSSGSTSSGLAIYLISSNSLLDAVVDEFGLLERNQKASPRKKPPQSPRAESRKALKKILNASFDDKSGVFSIEFTDTDPVFAQEVVNYCVNYLERRFNELGVDKNAVEKKNLEANIDNTYREILRLEEESHRLERTVSGTTNIPAITMEMGRLEMELEAQREVYKQIKTRYELLKITMASEMPVFQVLERAEIPDQKSGPSRGLLCIIVTMAGGFLSVFLAFVMNAVSTIRQDPEAMAKLSGKQPGARKTKR
ncbi:MAG: lipopolysaccharide biosynthesis protein [Treponema sp.]|jgi:uncharacterized protein involved in exopolysaccharide biosynthesis|nr:lipopolysaccharide biosynthesis protein [Treponema sp.]